jgi:hypothetical protein
LAGGSDDFDGDKIDRYARKPAAVLFVGFLRHRCKIIIGCTRQVKKTDHPDAARQQILMRAGGRRNEILKPLAQFIQ